MVDQLFLLHNMIETINCPMMATNKEEILVKNSIFTKTFPNFDLKSIDFNKEIVTIKDSFNINHTFKITSLDQNNTTFILKDITNELELEKIINNFLHIDSLTGYPNRTKLIQDLKKTSTPILSLAIIDLKDFKEINDFYGNQIGDFVLKQVADFINSQLSKDQTLYKFHADTYCIANYTLDRQSFIKLIKDILNKIDDEVIVCDQYEIDIRAIAGLSFSTKNNKLITADLALQAAKKNNKQYVIFYDELDNLQEYENNMTWTKKLKKAITEDKIVVYFQPLIDNETLKTVKYECLVRMIDDDRIVSPFFFLDIAKKSNQYTKITKIVIEKAFSAFAHLGFDFSINISYDDIEEESFLEFIKQMLQKYNQNNIANRVIFEILEDQNIKNYKLLNNFISEVKALGCKIAIDDFGSGYSNFEHIIQMKIDYLKIDSSLIKNIAIDDNSYQVTKTIVDFAKNLNLKTIAEFVENKDIFDITKAMGINYSQGYYFSPPLSYCDIKANPSNNS